MRSLETDSYRTPIFGLLTVAVLLGAWTMWAFLSRVARYEISDIARLEVDQSAHIVQAPMVGRIVASRLVLGREVKVGEILLEFDAIPEKLQIQEAQARHKVISPQIESIHAEIAATEQARLREQQATQAALEEARARFQEAESQARFAEGDAARLAQLHSSGLIPERDLVQAKAESEKLHAAAESFWLALRRLETEQRTRESDREVQLKRLQREIRSLEGQKITTAANIDRLQYEVERRYVRAPVAGRLADVAILRIGSVVQEGEKLAVVVPVGTLKAIAVFAPSAALGRVRVGQPARLRLHGFPWAQYGSIDATVSGVASEVRDGLVRVEFDVNSPNNPRIPVQHGLPGTIEVEVERISPATLILRAAGQLLASPTPASGPSAK
jgi:membrane fusion protein (multidrug efflux system)